MVTALGVEVVISAILPIRVDLARPLKQIVLGERSRRRQMEDSVVECSRLQRKGTTVLGHAPCSIRSKRSCFFSAALP